MRIWDIVVKENTSKAHISISKPTFWGKERPEGRSREQNEKIGEEKFAQGKHNTKHTRTPCTNGNNDSERNKYISAEQNQEHEGEEEIIKAAEKMFCVFENIHISVSFFIPRENISSAKTERMALKIHKTICTRECRLWKFTAWDTKQ